MRLAHTAAGALAIAAILAPNAAARLPSDEPASTTAYPAIAAPASPPVTADATPAAAPSVTRSIDDEDFDWGSAAIGAGGAGAALLLAAAGVSAAGHRRHQRVVH
ncbi:hypothetical protein DSM104299_03842 [Baekduia alba]|uniref:hypothetical protein n=1 Tax=Baekduia alba TaxID=2997333 RepID=UPI0023427359|nr:hypothetical protein [Baekduia alba]WCB95100.1 hypothetical protein DSM104299_03842 [Baekduia alba]